MSIFLKLKKLVGKRENNYNKSFINTQLSKAYCNVTGYEPTYLENDDGDLFSSSFCLTSFCSDFFEKNSTLEFIFNFNIFDKHSSNHVLFSIPSIIIVDNGSPISIKVKGFEYRSFTDVSQLDEYINDAMKYAYNESNKVKGA